MLHNDRQQEILWEMQQERRNPAALSGETAVSPQQVAMQTERAMIAWRNRLFWRSGELLIAAGHNLKCQVRPQYCG